jgi:predicted ATPase
MKIFLTNVRGFEGPHEIPIRPITILIGENSSGKTTLLAAISSVLNSDFPTVENLFNRAPFELGSFDTIATYRGGKYGRATSFSVGWTSSNEKSPRSIDAWFTSHNGIPQIDRIVAKSGSNELKVQVDKDNVEFELIYQAKRRAETGRLPPGERQTVKFKTELRENRPFRFQDTLRYYMEGIDVKEFTVKDRDGESYYSIFEELHKFTSSGRPHATALAPLRTRPRRTYDELNEEFKPEGDHVPRVLARLLATKQKGPSKELEALNRFGHASGLFEKIDVKRMGRQPSDPFQVRVKMKGPDANLIDVGYGVSQSLPIVIDSIVAPNKEVLLVQQPEVHLHPKAQAALGTFFAELAATTSKQFVIETHSDYLVDRVRIAVAEKTIPANKVQLLYLERAGLDVKVHKLELDDLGNITNAPPTYRDFFFQEEMSLMSRAT